jgi:hypothetical protein
MDFIPQWALGVGVILIAISVARTMPAVLRAIGGRSSARAGEPDADVQELRETVDKLQHRLTEVEERLDFAERLLAKPRSPSAP